MEFFRKTALAALVMGFSGAAVRFTEYHHLSDRWNDRWRW